MDFLSRLHGRAKEAGRAIVLPEGDEPRTLEAAVRAAAKGLARVTLLGAPEQIHSAARGRSLDLSGVTVTPVPADGREFDLALRAYTERTQHRGVRPDEAREHLKDPLLWGALQVAAGRYDGMVAGARSTTAHTLRAALRGIGVRPGVQKLSSFMLMVTRKPELGEGGVLVFADCGVN